MIISIKVITLLIVVIDKQEFIGISGGIDKYNNDINKYNIECNSNNRVKDNRECGILDIKC